jgi:hypothetical protein
VAIELSARHAVVSLRTRIRIHCMDSGIAFVTISSGLFNHSGGLVETVSKFLQRGCLTKSSCQIRVCHLTLSRKLTEPSSIIYQRSSQLEENGSAADVLRSFEMLVKISDSFVHPELPVHASYPIVAPS